MSTPLSNKYAFAALRDKRAEIAGRITALKKQITRHKTELAKLDGVIALFDPAYRVGDIPAKRAKQRSNLFKQGELGRLILDCLRKAGEPQSCPAITTYICEAIGQPDAGTALARTVRSNLAYMARHHRTVQKIGDAKWMLVGVNQKA
jgi:hypothetical protein